MTSLIEMSHAAQTWQTVLAVQKYDGNSSLLLHFSSNLETDAGGKTENSHGQLDGRGGDP